jgi:hypothetical protein
MSGVKVRAARDHYLASNGLSTDSYSSPLFRLGIGRVIFNLPNPGLLPWHDLHHIVTGFETDVIGEAEISVYELRCGCRSVMVHILCIGAILIGFFIAPKRIINAWKGSKGARTLYYTARPYEELLEMDVTDLRLHLGIPAEGLVGIESGTVPYDS